MKPLVFSLFVFCVPFVQAESTMVYFEKNSFELNQSAKLTLDSIAKIIRSKNLYGDILLTGHTDTDASDIYNQELGLYRTRSVRSYLEQLDIRNRFHLVSKGEKINVNGNKNENEMSLNRRVEIELDYQSDFSVFDQFKVKPQVFKINPFEETTITTEGGVQLVFGPEIFANTKEHLSVQINIQEFLNKEDFILANLTTQTLSDELLESGGMINIVAKQKNDTLNLKAGKSFDILFPERKVDDDMQLFQGINHGGEQLWNQTTFTPSLSKENVEWSTLYYKYTSDYFREKHADEFIDGDTIARTRTWYETIDEKAFKLTERIDAKGITVDSLLAQNDFLMDQLFQSSTTLGWINCDRFYDSDEPKETLYVRFDGEFAPTVTVVIDDLNSALRYSHREDNTLIFTGIPAGMDVTIVGLHLEEKTQRTLFATQKSVVRKGVVEFLNFEPSTMGEIQATLSTL